MSAYETCPWSVYNEEKAATCSAEVRMGCDADEIEAEIQIVYDNPEPGKPALEQILWLLSKPQTVSKWSIKVLRVKNEDKVNAFHNWDEKSCNFFSAVVQELKMGVFPDIEELLKKEMDESGSGHATMRGGGSKSPKIRPQQLLGMKNGRGI